MLESTYLHLQVLQVLVSRARLRSISRIQYRNSRLRSTPAEQPAELCKADSMDRELKILRVCLNKFNQALDEGEASLVRRLPITAILSTRVRSKVARPSSEFFSEVF